ncbi:acyl-CoA thioesterase [Flavimaricola marinus]|uniref:Thioesterase superfamily protein n=1 Tax=Flavimaricola marinus TaxID=1819565 RepID=A0A238LBB0_9RHOB|nr:acyl-CoA thioesterase [Flavimaricola marinus]SMY07017.1 hypothetical protein LOM8899_01148 [Flavimaricola marinus]
MYPFIRQFKSIWSAKRQSPLSILDVHVSQHRCWPHDLDMYLEMNNGRVLTMLDLGRYGLAVRAGLIKMLARERWGLAVAGATTRYRKRIRPFAKFEMRTRCIGWDDKFLYMEQTIWLGEECAFQGLLRTCLTDRNGIVSTQRSLAAYGADPTSPPLPAWVQAWIDADAVRPWPPERPGPR